MTRQIVSQTQILKILTDLGFSDNESRIYIAMLSTGPARVAEIAKAAGIKRTTTYSVLSNLYSRGFVSLDPSHDSKKYTAEHPQMLSSILNSRLETFQKYLPELIAMFNLKGKTADTRIYSGIEGSKNAYEILLKTAKPGQRYSVLADINKWYRLDPQFFSDFVERRAKLGLRPKHILTDNKFSRAWFNKIRKLGSVGKFLPRQVDLSANLICIESLVVIHQLSAPIQAIVIESPIVADMMQNIFDLIWHTIPGEGLTLPA